MPEETEKVAGNYWSPAIISSTALPYIFRVREFRFGRSGMPDFLVFY